MWQRGLPVYTEEGAWHKYCQLTLHQLVLLVLPVLPVKHGLLPQDLADRDEDAFLHTSLKQLMVQLTATLGVDCSQRKEVIKKLATEAVNGCSHASRQRVLQAFKAAPTPQYAHGGARAAPARQLDTALEGGPGPTSTPTIHRSTPEQKIMKQEEAACPEPEPEIYKVRAICAFWTCGGTCHKRPIPKQLHCLCSAQYDRHGLLEGTGSAALYKTCAREQAKEVCAGVLVCRALTYFVKIARFTQKRKHITRACSSTYLPEAEACSRPQRDR